MRRLSSISIFSILSIVASVGNSSARVFHRETARITAESDFFDNFSLLRSAASYFQISLRQKRRVTEENGQQEAQYSIPVA